MKRGKRAVALLLSLVMVWGLALNASAATPETVTVQLSPNITVKLDGEVQTMTDVNGNPVYPVLYGGTTYLPIRAVGNMLGLDVDWDGATQTVILEKADSKTNPAKNDSKTPADTKPTEITVQINPNITVKYNGKAQAMTDVNGNPVYPMLYGGTTYLPVRAVSNMLGVKVEWDGESQTVLLSTQQTGNSSTTEGTTLTAFDKDGNPVNVDLSNPDEARETLKALGWADELITQMLGKPTIGDSELFNGENQVAKMETTPNGKVLGENHISYDWAEIDWSNASQGYIRVKANEQLTAYTRCTVHWYEEEVEDWELHNQSKQYAIPEGKWTNIPLTGDSTDFAVIIEQGMRAAEIEALQKGRENAKSEEEFNKVNANYRDPVQVCFTGKQIDEAALWLLSYSWVDYENAPEVCAKAQELTKNCKTDAEKITVIFEYVTKTIKYDQARYKKIIADTIAIRTGKQGPVDPLLEALENHQTLSETMSSKKGVCDDYARLMAAMLRSVGVPCKVCSGDVYTGEIIKNYSDDGWAPHAWVAVKPETGTLDMKALGAGKDYAPIQIGESYNENPTGWIRLDPTWGDTSSGRAAAAVDKNHRTDDCY